MAEPPGVDVPSVSQWLAAHVDGATPPFRFDLIAGGHSNLTYCVTDHRGERYVLRRPPLGHVLPSAHDMGREHRIISALGPTAVPVAPALGYCMLDSGGHVVAVLDWEICTLGDPLADVGLLHVYWTGPDDEPSAWTGSGTAVTGFPNRAELLDRYAKVSGRDLSAIDFYVA